jgi:hypothetical protein
VPIRFKWAIARAVTETLNPVVSQCVVNQTRGYWLLSNTIAGALKLIVQMEAEQLAQSSVEPPLECGEFDSELKILYGRMARQVADVLRPFLSFARKFEEGSAHNMICLMLDLHFKGLEVIVDYVGCGVAKEVVDEYNGKVLVPLLVKATQFLSRIATAEPATPSALQTSKSILFGALASTVEASKGLLLVELSLFRRLDVEADGVTCPLTWWFE